MGMKEKPDRGKRFCCFFCFQCCSGQQAAKTITVLTRATTIPGHITKRTQPTSLTTIDFIIAALYTSVAARIMSGRQVTGHFAPVSPPSGGRVSAAGTADYLTLVSSCGSMGVISLKDTKPLRLARCRGVSRLPAVTSPPTKPRVGNHRRQSACYRLELGLGLLSGT